MVRAGAAFADRRKELGLSQRELARMKIMTAANLIEFEKGRSWPREKTRAKLEFVARWPPGTLARVRAGGEANINGATEGDGWPAGADFYPPLPGPPGALDQHRGNPSGATEPLRAVSDATAVVIDAVTVAVAKVFADADQLPGSGEPMFAARVRAVLADLRTLESITVRAVRSSQGSPEVIRSLREIRQRYEQLMSRAAAAPGATLGQRLYAARTAASLTPTEAGAAMNVAAEVVMAVEAETAVSDEHKQRIEAFIATLGGV
ncbi:helix-turn-helix domain-containing protein [Mycobacterium intracellulare]|uniref:helix-turn-helix domain-containing protein n=1 Tax=Mycobacterium intracellulare TaxID=1767 RepID=UPI001F5293EB|nr:helix-turn-helix transcriptional regulator [Mycobacterium intracellulare]